MPSTTSAITYEAVAGLVRRSLKQHLSLSDPEDTSTHALFHSPRAVALKNEIVAAGRKLWHRQYVDGNGGNISARLSADLVLCTPTMLSKGDIVPEDLALVDLDNHQIAGNRLRTSEIKLHLEIYKSVPQAQAVIHCHPPYATAHAVAGMVPQGDLVPEQEVFVGPLVLAPYETPGTLEFARTVLPMARQHNTILLANHGIVCWADTVTHAEWYAEVVETYCKTVMIASQLRSPLPTISPDKIQDLLDMKRRLGLPDARLPLLEDPLPKAPPADFTPQALSANGGLLAQIKSSEDLEALTSAITTEVLRLVEGAA